MLKPKNLINFLDDRPGKWWRVRWWKWGTCSDELGEMIFQITTKLGLKEFFTKIYNFTFIHSCMYSSRDSSKH